MEQLKELIVDQVRTFKSLLLRLEMVLAEKAYTHKRCFDCVLKEQYVGYKRYAYF